MDRTKEAIQFLFDYDLFLNKLANNLKQKCPRYEVEDIKQQMALNVLQGCNKYKEEKTAIFTTYCCTIAINCAASLLKKYYEMKNRVNIDCVSLDDYIAKDKGGKTFNDVLMEDEWDLTYPVALYEYNEGNRLLDDITDNLPPFERKVLKYFLSGYDIVEIAKKTKKSTKTIYSVINKIKEKFKMEL